MPLDTWFAFVAASMALLVIPGPTVLLVLSYALSRGRAVALATAAGVATGDFLALTASLAGLGALVMASAQVFTIVKLAGAAYLVWLGIGLIRSAGTSTIELPGSDKRRDALGIYGHATAVTSLNPKSLAFFIAFAPQFLDQSSPLLPQMLVMVPTFVGLAAFNAMAFALLADRLRSRIARPGTVAWIGRGGGAAIVVMGVALAFTRRGPA